MRNESVFSPNSPAHETKGMVEAVQFFTADCRLHLSKNTVQSMGEQYKIRTDETTDVLYHARGEGFRRMAYIIAMGRG